jgi:hypothetical protein
MTTAAVTSKPSVMVRDACVILIWRHANHVPETYPTVDYTEAQLVIHLLSV